MRGLQEEAKRRQKGQDRPEEQYKVLLMRTLSKFWLWEEAKRSQEGQDRQRSKGGEEELETPGAEPIPGQPPHALLSASCCSCKNNGVWEEPNPPQKGGSKPPSAMPCHLCGGVKRHPFSVFQVPRVSHLGDLPRAP